jgi:predicted nucleic-acid-binding protein
MKITVDTNVLVRAVVRDDAKQAQVAAKLLKDAELIAVSLPCLCEFAWVLRRVYNFGQRDISAALGALLDAGNVVVNRPPVEAG